MTGEVEKPELKLAGLSGNAFAILGRAESAARKAGWGEKETDEMMQEATSGDYDHLLQTMMKHFEVS